MKKSLETNLKKLNVAIVAHIFATGPALELEQFLAPYVTSLTFIGHPFAYKKGLTSFKRSYKKGKLVSNVAIPKILLPGTLIYLKDALITFWWILLSDRKIDLYVGSDGFVSFLGLILKRLGKVKNVILYTIDFMPTRFNNSFLNWLYHYFDEQCLKHCKIIWNLSDKMAAGREEYMSTKRQLLVPQITVPLGIWDKRIRKLKFKEKNRYQIVFMGHLLKKQGLDIVLEAMPKILNKIPKANLLIIGTGDYEETLIRKAKKLKIESKINFAGFVEDHKSVEDMLSQSMVAVAPYKPDPESFTYFADPGKIKNYLSAGLPVILTNVPPIAKDIKEKKCAFIIDYTSESLAEIIIKLLSSPTLINEYSNNAVKYAKNFDWDSIFPKALEKSLN